MEAILNNPDDLASIIRRYDVSIVNLFSFEKPEVRTQEIAKLIGVAERLREQLNLLEGERRTAGSVTNAVNYRDDVATGRVTYSEDSPSAKLAAAFKATLDDAFEVLADDELALALVREHLANKLKAVDNLIEYNLSRQQNKQVGVIHSSRVLANEYKLIRDTLIRMGAINASDLKALSGKFSAPLVEDQYKSRFYAVDWATVTESDVHIFSPGESFFTVAYALGFKINQGNGKVANFSDFLEWFEHAYNWSFDRLIALKNGDEVTLEPLHSIAPNAPTVILTVNRSF